MSKIPGWKKGVYIWLFRDRFKVLFHKYMQTPEFHVSGSVKTLQLFLTTDVYINSSVYY